MRKILLSIASLLSFLLFSEEPLKVLHLCFHDGCVDEINGIAEACNLKITSWNIHKLPPYYFEPAIEGGNRLYNMNYERTSRIWEKHKDFFEEFDVILTSDTTALSRIFLQHEWAKPLVIWVTIRFDWSWRGESRRKFPEPEFYTLLNEAKQKKNVFIAASSPYELFYARQKGVDLGERVIKPCAAYLPEKENERRLDPLKNQQIFIHERTEQVQALYNRSFVISKVLQNWQIPSACYRYDSLLDLGAHKGVLYLPYQWCVISLFETLRLGLPMFVPSESFLLKMIHESNYFFEEKEYLVKNKLFSLAEWYHPSLQDIVIYFDSWPDLQKKAAELDYQAVHDRSVAYGKAHTAEMVARWKDLFKEVRSFRED